jgi:hypothetical protein
MSLSLSSIAVLLSSLALCSASLVVPAAIAATPSPTASSSTIPSPIVTPSLAATPIPQPFLIKITYAGGNRRSNGQPPEFIIRADGVSFYRFMGKETPHRVLGPRGVSRLN